MLGVFKLFLLANVEIKNGRGLLNFYIISTDKLTLQQVKIQ